MYETQKAQNSKKFFYLRLRERERHSEKELLTTDALPTCTQRLGLCPMRLGNLELFPGLLYGCRGPSIYIVSL